MKPSARIETYVTFAGDVRVRVFGVTLNDKRGNPRTFKTEAAAIAAGEKYLSDARKRIGE